MLASVVSHAPVGIDGHVVRVEVDLRRGIPGIDLVGLPDGAVRESRERVRVAIRNSGYRFPQERVLVNLAPAGIRKEGASFDLAIALAILAASGQLPAARMARVMVVGELNLSGRIRPVRGAIAAVGAGLQVGITDFLVPEANSREAACLGAGRVMGVGSLQEAGRVLSGGACRPPPGGTGPPQQDRRRTHGDLAEIKGHPILKETLVVAAAGRHNLLLFGPPGSGKTMAALRLGTLLPPLDREEALAVTRIHSVAGVLDPGVGLIAERPFRAPHHSASREGIIGGGSGLRPGEASLAHSGVLFLDEVLEFASGLLQGLREPVESRQVTIVRAGASVRYPAGFQLVMTANACPCGKLGSPGEVCACSEPEIGLYWRRLGGAMLDRMDMRVAVEPVTIDEMLGPAGESSEEAAARVADAAVRQRRRYADEPFGWNAEIPPGAVDRHCALEKEVCELYARSVGRFHLSSRACHSILKVARTVADLAAHDRVEASDLLAAVHYRRYGKEDKYWATG